jgi:hypothetical protein
MRFTAGTVPTFWRAGAETTPYSAIVAATGFMAGAALTLYPEVTAVTVS